MKTIAIGLCVILLCFDQSVGQTNNASGKVIEGGKVVVELIKALNGRKDLDRNPGCKGKYADLCVVNESAASITVELNHQVSEEKREMVILPSSKECCLRISVGVWTYDLHTTKQTESIRKGDLLIEGCQNLIMNIKI
jgi:hypothetical protein